MPVSPGDTAPIPWTDISVFFGVLTAAASLLLVLRGSCASRPSCRHLIPRVALDSLTIALLFGEVINGFHRASGFSFALFFVGSGAIAFLYLLRFGVVPIARLSRAFASLRLLPDLRETDSARSRNLIALLLSTLVVLVLFYFSYLALIYLHAPVSSCPRPLLRATAEALRQSSFADTVLIRECVSQRLYNPVVFLHILLIGDRPVESGILLYFIVNLLVVLSIFLLRTFTVAPRQSLLKVHLSNVVFFLFLVSSLTIIHDDHVELAFSFLFLVNFLLILRIRYSLPYLLLLGLVSGFVFFVKEVNVINIALVVVLLFLSRSPTRNVAPWLGAFVFGLLVATLPMVLYSGLCNFTEGMSHSPFLYFRGYELSALSQEHVKRLFEQGFQVGFLDVVRNRLSFQTVGEVIWGGVAACSLYLFTLFPLPFILSNADADKRRTFGLLVVLAMLFYGLSYWKGGDSANPFFTLAPVGYVYYGGFLTRLLDVVRTRIRNGNALVVGNAVPFALLALNLAFLGFITVEAAKVMAHLRYVDRISLADVSFSYAPTEGEERLIRAIEELQEESRVEGEGDFQILSENCSYSDLHFLPLSGLSFPILTLDPPHSFAAGIREGDIAQLRSLGALHFSAAAEGILLICNEDLRLSQDDAPDRCVDLVARSSTPIDALLLRFRPEFCPGASR